MNDGKRFITDIRTGNRRRQSLGYLNQLAASIADEGLHDPIVITPGSQLISGYRRMKAAKLLGLEDIPVHVAGSLAEAVNLIAAEGSTCQVPMAAVELVDYIGIIRTLRRTPRMSTVREAGNAILDYSYSKYCLVQQVVEAAREEVDADGPAHQGLAVVDAILAGQRPRGQGGHLASLKAIAEELVGPPVPLHRTAPVAPLGRRPAARTQAKALGSAMAALSGLVAGLNQVDSIDPTIAPVDADRWMADINRAQRALRTLNTKLKEHADATR